MLKYETQINVIDDGEQLGVIRSHDIHYKTKRPLSWQFRASTGISLGPDDLRDIATKLEQLEIEAGA